MEWGRLYANLPDDPRVQAAEDDGGAGFLLIESMCYLTSAETGGFIPHTQVERFGGGPKKKQKIAALVREKLWIPVEDGYLIDPRIWTEERNLSDQAEKKREADRNRMAAKRAAARSHNGHESRDSRATGLATDETTNAATCSSDSRGPEKRREEIPVAVVSHPSVSDAQESDDDDIGELEAAAITAFLDRTSRLITPAESRTVAAKVLDRAAAKGLVVHHPPRYVAAAIDSERDPYSLLGEPPPLGEILGRQAFAKRPSCGQCDPRTRMLLDEFGQPGNQPCPACHPRALEAS